MTSETMTVRERPMICAGSSVRAILDGTKTQTRRVVKGLTPDVANAMESNPGMMLILHESGYGGLQKRDAAGVFSIPLPRCPYGAPGARLWVRETWSAQYDYPEEYQGTRMAWYHKTPAAWRLGSNALRTYYRADRSIYDACDYGEHGIDLVRNLSHGEAPRWVPAIHMPRWASRLTLQVTDVRAERLQDISDEDALAEGIRRVEPTAEDIAWGCEAEDVVFIAPGVRQGWGATKALRAQERWAPSARLAYSILWDSINAKRGYGWDTNPWVWVISFERVAG